MVELFFELLSLLGIVIILGLLLVVASIIIVVIGAFISSFIDVCREKVKKQKPYKTVSEIKEQGVYMATKEGIVKIDDGEK